MSIFTTRKQRKLDDRKRYLDAKLIRDKKNIVKLRDKRISSSRSGKYFPDDESELYDNDTIIWYSSDHEEDDVSDYYDYLYDCDYFNKLIY